MKKKWRGGHIHNLVLLGPIAEMALAIPKARVDREAAIKVGDRILYGDLLIQTDHFRVLVEVELTAKRAVNDLAKAAAVAPCELWIVVPNRRVREAVKRRLSVSQLFPAQDVTLFIFLFSQALQRLTTFTELISGSNDGRNRKENNLVNIQQHAENKIDTTP